MVLSKNCRSNHVPPLDACVLQTFPFLHAPVCALHRGCRRVLARPIRALRRVAETIAPANPRGVFQAKEPFMAGKEQKRGNKESKKPKQKPVAVVDPIAPGKPGATPPLRAGKKG